QYYYSPHIGNGIINPTENRNALIYPNPARDFVNIQLAQFPSEPVTVKLFNNCGKLLLSQPIGNNGETISLKSFPVGIYLLQLENGRNKELVKVIKQ
ncbi:MAG TPA: T9SS type A sorting domain-containing protein, partial [Bacteroidales bacterium]|nr:T9SS type A sorting domain-containing protein [Bacteroidales bacterium]